MWFAFTKSSGWSGSGRQWMLLQKGASWIFSSTRPVSGGVSRERSGKNFLQSFHALCRLILHLSHTFLISRNRKDVTKILIPPRHSPVLSDAGTSRAVEARDEAIRHIWIIIFLTVILFSGGWRVKGNFRILFQARWEKQGKILFGSEEERKSGGRDVNAYEVALHCPQASTQPPSCSVRCFLIDEYENAGGEGGRDGKKWQNNKNIFNIKGKRGCVTVRKAFQWCRWEIWRLLEAKVA